MRTHLLPVALLLALPTFCQTLAPLTVGKIMRDPAQWIGTSPSEIQWSEDSKTVYFKWNPERRKADSLYAVTLNNPTPRQVEPTVRRSLPAAGGIYNRGKTERVYAKDGDVYWLDARTGRVTQITATVEAESNPAFSHDETKILFTQGDNLFAWRKAGGGLVQLTDFRKGKKPDKKLTEGDKWLEADQRRWIETVRERGD